jgi:hypothetical protein
MAGARMAAFIGRLKINANYSEYSEGTKDNAGAHAVSVDSGATHMTERNENKWK